MIPNVFHFVFGLKPQVEPFHLMHYLCLASCLEVNRPDALVFHYHHEPFGEWWDRIKPRLSLRRVALDELVERFQYRDRDVARYRYAHAADFLRLQVLLDEGGIYADIDTLFLRPLPDRLRAYGCVLGEERSPQPGTRSLCNAWIGAERGSRFCAIWLEEMRRSFDGSWSEHSTLLPYRLAQRHPDLLHIEPETSFYSFDWTPARIDDLLVRMRPVVAEAYSLHLWNHLWWDAQRRDFSSFHAGRLTPCYVAYASTTYATWARRFLPADARCSRSGWRLEQAVAGAEGLFGKLRNVVGRMLAA